MFLLVTVILAYPASTELPHRESRLDTQHMPAGVAVVALVIAVLLGYYWARWRRSEATLKVARTGAGADGRRCGRPAGSCC